MTHFMFTLKNGEFKYGEKKADLYKDKRITDLDDKTPSLFNMRAVQTFNILKESPYRDRSLYIGYNMLENTMNVVQSEVDTESTDTLEIYYYIRNKIKDVR